MRHFELNDVPVYSIFSLTMSLTASHSSLAQVCMAFTLNVQRAFSIIRCPMNFVEGIEVYLSKLKDIALHLEHHNDKLTPEQIESIKNRFKTFSPETLNVIDSTHSEISAWIFEKLRTLEPFDKLPLDINNFLNYATHDVVLQNEGAAKGQVASFGRQVVMFLLKSNTMQQWLYNQLLSGLVQIWTAFEVLASDSLKTILNEYPKPFGMRVAGEQQIQIKKLMDEYGGNISKCLGDLLGNKRASFSELSSLFYQAFDKNLKKNDRDIEIHSILENPKLYRLNKIRNLIVHQGGIVDDDFRNDRLLACFTIGSDGRIDFTPAEYGELVIEPIVMGIKLIERLTTILKTQDAIQDNKLKNKAEMEAGGS